MFDVQRQFITEAAKAISAKADALAEKGNLPGGAKTANLIKDLAWAVVPGQSKTILNLNIAAFGITAGMSGSATMVGNNFQQAGEIAGKLQGARADVAQSKAEISTLKAQLENAETQTAKEAIAKDISVEENILEA